MKNKIYPIRLDASDREIFERLGARFMMPTAKLIKGVARQLFSISEQLKSNGELKVGELPRISVAGVAAPLQQKESLVVELSSGSLDWSNKVVRVGENLYKVSLSITPHKEDKRQTELPKGSSAHRWTSSEDGNLVAVPVVEEKLCRKCEKAVAPNEPLALFEEEGAICGRCNKAELEASVDKVLPVTTTVQFKEGKYEETTFDREASQRQYRRLRLEQLTAASKDFKALGSEPERVEVKSRVPRRDWVRVGVLSMEGEVRCRYDGRYRNRRFLIGEAPRFFSLPPESIDLIEKNDKVVLLRL